MTRRLGWLIVGMSTVLTWGALAPLAQEASRYAGQTDKGFLLPNGWTLQPAGEQMPLADLPLNLIPMADNRHVLAATS
ncbi:MAG TPA: hypothetical protein VFF52_07955, partial [Isosphaeraceae bacterium]|nr:hypothetical protein [Isosphaeraceae bacterium]